MTDDATINKRAGHKKLLCQNGDGTWLPHYHISFCLKFESDRVINYEKQRSADWLAATHNYRLRYFWLL